MRRTNTFRLSPTKGQEQRLFELAENCARMFNEINYKRRQSLFSGNFDWNTDEFYHKYKKLIGSATAQTITRKNNEAWKSFFALLRLKKQGKLPKNMNKVSSPSYWKDRKTGKRVLIILIRCDCYKLDENYLKLPFKLKVRWKGQNRWKGKQGRLEIHYDNLSSRWSAHMPVKVEKPLHQPKGNKKAYVDLGIINIITSWIEGEKRPEIYSGRNALSDWWYWNGKIGEHQSIIEKNKKIKTAKRLRKLFRKRKKRFRHAINTIIARFVKNCWEKGVSEIVIGDVTNIRENGGRKGKKANAMINNFWSFNYIYERLRITAENYGIKMKKKDEKYTSKTCSLCGKVHRNGRKHRGLYVCKTHRVTMNADVNGVANIANPIFPKPYWDRDNWLVAQPLLHKTGVETPRL
ncbi:MAG: RNA-guided endonuclease InsQ/TnpB family protein [Asgard group archaeon]